MSDLKYDKMDDDAADSSAGKKKCLCYSLLVGIIVAAAIVIIIVVVGGGSSNDDFDSVEETNNYKPGTIVSDTAELYAVEIEVTKADETVNVEEPTLDLTVTTITNKIARMTIIPKGDAEKTESKDRKYQIPSSFLPRPTETVGIRLNEDLGFIKPAVEAERVEFTFSVPEVGIKQADWIEAITTKNRKLTINDETTVVGFTIPSQHIFGLGERTTTFGLTTGNYTVMAKDRGSNTFDDGTGDKQTYGSHPFIVWQIKDNKFGGLVHLSSIPSNLEIKFSKTDKSVLTWTTLAGGISDFYFIFGNSPVEVIEQYSLISGKPILPPFWALGYQLSSWGWQTLAEMKEADTLSKANGFTA
jgi:alpha-glucosidase (family GH31 glycosyl hydrolase)